MSRSKTPRPPEDYEVGYRKPPTRTQFKPGQSGNPRGRPKKTRTLDEDIARELNRTIRIRENGEELKVTKRRAVAKAAVNLAAKGDRAAMRLLLNHISAVENDPERSMAERERDEISAEDWERFERHYRPVGVAPKVEDDGAA